MSLVTDVGIVSAADKEAEAYKEIQNKYRTDYLIPRDRWQSALALLVGVYSLIKQHQIMKEYLNLAKDQVKQAERYLKLAEDHYATISVPTFKCQKKLFERYLTEFSGRENAYLEEAFRLKEYTPEYKLQEGRALATVQMMFDKAALQRRRQIGKYNVGRACHDNTYFAVTMAQAKVAAANHGYRFEEARKFKLDQWYWARQSAGIGIVDSMAGRVVSGLNGGAAVATSGLNAVGGAYGIAQNAFKFVENGYTNLANFWGSVANTAFQYAGYQQGRSQAMPFGGSMGGGMASPSSMGANIESSSGHGDHMTSPYGQVSNAQVLNARWLPFAAES